MFNYSNCDRCAHKKIPPNLKLHFSLTHKTDFFGKCFEDFTLKEGEKTFCFTQGMTIDWVGVQESFDRAAGSGINGD